MAILLYIIYSVLVGGDRQICTMFHHHHHHQCHVLHHRDGQFSCRGRKNVTALVKTLHHRQHHGLLSDDAQFS